MRASVSVFLACVLHIFPWFGSLKRRLVGVSFSFLLSFGQGFCASLANLFPRHVVLFPPFGGSDRPSATSYQLSSNVSVQTTSGVPGTQTKRACLVSKIWSNGES